MSSVERQEIKQVVMEAIEELMSENREMLKELLIETLDDIALLQRMEEGRETELIGREEVMKLLEPKR